MAGRNSKANQAVAVLPGGSLVTFRGRQDHYPSRPTVVTWEGWEKECRVVAGAETDFKIDYDGKFFFTDTLSTLDETYGVDDVVLALKYWLGWNDRIAYFTEKAHAMAVLYVRMFE